VLIARFKENTAEAFSSRNSQKRKKRPLLKPNIRQEDNIRTDFRKTGRDGVAELMRLRKATRVSSSEYSNTVCLPRKIRNFGAS
jgi:hypothetical protein